MDVKMDMQKIRDKNCRQEAIKKIINDKAIALALKEFNGNIVNISRRKSKLCKVYPSMEKFNDNIKWFFFLEDCPQLRVKRGMFLPYKKDTEEMLVKYYEISFLVVTFLKDKKLNICKEIIFK